MTARSPAFAANPALGLCVGPGDGNDWFPFLERRPLLAETSVTSVVSANRIFFSAIDAVTDTGDSVLDAGCGTGARMIAYARLQQRTLVLLDRDPRVLAIARKNVRAIAFERVWILLANIFHLRRIFERGHFGAVTHHGVLEHYRPPAIRRILAAQLGLAPHVVFAVPIKSERNQALFGHDGIRRNLWHSDFWTEHILRGFTLVATESVATNKDELIITITSSSRRKS
jgi:SAM-dependent methyltransferase